MQLEFFRKLTLSWSRVRLKSSSWRPPITITPMPARFTSAFISWPLTSCLTHCNLKWTCRNNQNCLWRDDTEIDHSNCYHGKEVSIETCNLSWYLQNSNASSSHSFCKTIVLCFLMPWTRVQNKVADGILFQIRPQIWGREDQKPYLQFWDMLDIIK